MLNHAIPFIERLASGEAVSCDASITTQIQRRCKMAQIAIKYLRGGDNDESYYEVINRFLREPESRRLLLYLPLSDLQNAPEWFYETYLDAWYELLNVQDARENFYEGDTFEVDARPDGQLERVVKCAHLTPWLVEARFLSYTDLKRILELNQDNEVLLRSFANTWQMLKDRRLLEEAEIDELKSLTARVSQRAQLSPLYISEGREKWLHEREEQPQRETLLTPNVNLAGPFSPNIEAFMDVLETIQRALGPKEIVLVGGSRLKGYGTTLSDLDIFRLEELDRDPEMKAGNPHATHIHYNTLWLGGNEVDDLSKIATDYATVYFGSPKRRFAIERIESDLLQYRLLHKGFVRFYGGHDSIAKNYPEMDGNCPFYDDKYRRIATELFVKYVFIPTSST